MFHKTKYANDAFTFSLGGLSTVSPFLAAPAVAWDRINQIRDERLELTLEDQPNTAREIEDVLARYFAPGRRQAA